LVFDGAGALSSLKIALFSPMPPSKSGIADYSEALVASLGARTQLTVFDKEPPSFNPSAFDITLYQLGNNPWHGFVYEYALRYPGVAVMHEGNLHHLIADLTIKRGDWDTYFIEAELNGGAEARIFAEQHVRTLKCGPDYEGLPMTRRLLNASRGLIVHSHFVEARMREQGFEGPIATIPHGAWIPRTDRNGARAELGLHESTPLIGAFGYLKPYKRIAESLRALRRLVALDPRVRMILVGESHPEFPVHQLIATLGLDEYVRVIGFAPIEKFVEYMGACDIILNLRYPTVGETSGSLQRALGLGKAVIVSDVGSFAELPDDICLKVPAGPDLVTQEEDLIFEYLNVLVSRPDLAQGMGARAKAWVERECNWDVVADRYTEFLEEVHSGKVRPQIAHAAAVAAPAQEFFGAIEPGVVSSWVDPWVTKEARSYASNHVTRFAHTLELTPMGDASKAILEMGIYLQITPSLKSKLNYGTIRGCYYGPAGQTDRRAVTTESGEVFECEVDLFDAERDVYPYADESFDTVLCCELLEHLPGDPMHMMSEINRILKPGGHLLITTPNIASLRALGAILQGYHPSFFPAYIRPRRAGEDAEARHNREYVPNELALLFHDAGFEIIKLETGEFLDAPHPEFGWIHHLLAKYKLPVDLRGDGIYALGRKSGPVKQRWPGWLYA
jgi:glycosyltransferase involved in cell wall biosynthesis/SAM-dependent methyltransferase